MWFCSTSYVSVVFIYHGRNLSSTIAASVYQCRNMSLQDSSYMVTPLAFCYEHFRRRSEEVDELVSKVAEVVEVREQMEVLAKSLTLLLSSLSSYNTYFLPSSPKWVIMNGCSYKDFVACKPKEFDGKGSAVAYIHWVEKMEAVHDISGCGDHWKATAIGMTLENFKALMREEYCLSNEMLRLETEFWSHSMVGAGHLVYTDQFH
ncbi:hypothetical protein Tco_1518640 [Tanacetum coccineum]